MSTTSRSGRVPTRTVIRERIVDSLRTCAANDAADHRPRSVTTVDGWRAFGHMRTVAGRGAYVPEETVVSVLDELTAAGVIERGTTRREGHTVPAWRIASSA